MLFVRAWLLLAALVTATQIALAADDEDEEPEYRPGLVARYTDAGGTTLVRRDADVQFAWGAKEPDERLDGGSFHVAWSGRLFSIAPGEYRLHVFAAGRVRLSLAGKSLLDKQSAEPAWMAAEPIELSYGYHPFTLEYEPAADAGRIGLFWSGPQFQLEPIPDRHFFHLPNEAPPETFEQGALLTRALRCTACHEIAADEKIVAAPGLNRLRGNLEPGWLVEWLTAKPQANVEAVPRRMPHFDFTSDEARAIATYLFATSQQSPEAPKFHASMVPTPPLEPGKKKPKKPRTKPSEKEGERLVNTLGCLACHRLGDRGSHALFGGGELTAIADKRPPTFFAHWLTKPEEINRSHRMPVFRLEAIEWADLSTYLATLSAAKSDGKSWKPKIDDRELIELGRRLVVEHRCGNCHALPDAPREAPQRSKLAERSRWDHGCLAAPDERTHRPGYELAAVQQTTVREYILGAKHRSPTLDGAYVLAERNCLGCHARGLSPGIAANLDAVVRADGELGPLLPTLAPPSLTGVGDKLHDEALAAAILLKNPPLRPWLAIRMPKFPLEAEEMRKLVGMFVDHDRVPPLPSGPAEPAADLAQVLAARRLVTAEGFGCTSCHKIGSSEPVKVALNAHGTDLTMLGERIRRPWYDRWVRNPARIVPRMEMPAIQLPVRGVLHDNVNEQLAAVWNTLNTPGFNPPPPGPVRTVRARNLPGVNEPASILTDVLEVGDEVYTRPLIIGLPNRHNVLFDLEAGRLANWWIGDMAMQRTRGKSWYWTPGGDPLLPVLPQDELPRSDYRLRSQGETTTPATIGQVRAVLDSFGHSTTGAAFSYRLSFGSMPRELIVTETITPRQTSSGSSGFRRRLEITGLATGDEILIDLLPRNSIAEPSKGKPAIDVLMVQGSPREAISEGGTCAVLSSRRPVCELDYVVDLPVDQFPVTVPALPNPPAVKLDVVPGWQAVQLPLPVEEMATGFDWRADGSLVFSSLKGRVCVARDTDGDGMEDTVTPLSDDLATPYGVAANNDGTVDVICKYGLVRLHDDDNDGRAERSEIVADGWGMTNDYHDWVVGLPRDKNGDYIVALPCQQDDRDEAAARLRGEALRLVPREPTADNPRRFRIEPFAAGLRFPMGVAINRAGAIFASDNQGNYNPYNEINQLVPGQRYGFINKRDVRPGFKPSFQTAAIDLPHPWTRSVNGMCFLYTPPALREKLGHHVFGPFEGHLIGCEYTTLRLIRMTLEKVGDSYQGAAYPFSIVPPEGKPTFEGPVVCAVSPRGDLYVGNMRDSGWGGGQNTGSFVRLRPTGYVPLGIHEVRATSDGLTIKFTGKVDARRAADVKNYSVLSYRRIVTPAYGGENVDERAGHVKSVHVSDDARRVKLKIDAMRAGHVYELRVANLAADGKPLHPAEAYYTLKHVPNAR
ncbi:MAG TPA: PA14 domain-containing protein [Pirellulales bacterium]|jgi:mono/diheme cytochrome c family protein|nr:PA14 domain-containing protein [Pirellulales bacterium]